MRGVLTATTIYNQINRLTTQLIQSGLCEAQNHPSRRFGRDDVEEISVSNIDHSIFLKSIPYSEMFRRLLETKTYNMKMIDGALISLSYRFKSNRLIASRLSYFPSPDLVSFQNEPELYWDDELYGDILDKRVVAVPIRFDFDADVNTYKPIVHPKSHLTIGQFKNCRIPVSSALTPYQFLLFIVMNFYNCAYVKCSSLFTVCRDSFDSTIFAEERELLHMNTPVYGD